MRLEEMLDEMIWVGKSLFDRGKISGSSANLSFRYEENIYITRSGACAGRLSKSDFVRTTLDGMWNDNIIPSKELPMHLEFYRKDPQIGSVIHMHSPYATLLSCMNGKEGEKVIKSYTPYLSMKVGSVVRIGYHPPGSRELFDEIRSKIQNGNAFLLDNHGIVVGGKTIMDAFYKAEEIEESSKIQFLLESTGRKVKCIK